MAFLNGMAFSIYNNDNDLAFGSCAFARRGAWWYGNSHKSNLNGSMEIPIIPMESTGFSGKDLRIL